MFTRFKRSSRVLFLDPLSESVEEYEKGTKVSIILSPSLYWVKKMLLLVKSVREVKKLLPSIFEDILPTAHYSYTAYKSDDEFLLFAYEDKQILDLLNKQGINVADVVSVHFAQNEFVTLENAISINQTQSMYNKDGVLLLVPSAWIDSPSDMDLTTITLSKHTIKLQQFGHIVDNNSLYKIGAILIVLVLILLVEIFVAGSKRDAVIEAKDELFTKYKLQSTMFQNRSTQSKYNAMHTTQTKLRENISYFLKMKLKKDQKITLIDYREGILHVTLSGIKKANEKSITSQLAAKKVKYKTSFSKESMKVEIKL